MKKLLRILGRTPSNPTSTSPRSPLPSGPRTLLPWTSKSTSTSTTSSTRGRRYRSIVPKMFIYRPWILRSSRNTKKRLPKRTWVSESSRRLNRWRGCYKCKKQKTPAKTTPKHGISTPRITAKSSQGWLILLLTRTNSSNSAPT